ncbi:type II toxin-antitoxin system RelE/ParE family toxin [Sphingomonas sp. dw_22]|uniref:type II toxin-antitoxin system RelE/ParE family toxin n=1 Tax=Sphingomonas sp. dw_22 TaxID=2721175 RepID=UPI001BD3778F
MTRFRIEPSANHRLDEIFEYSSLQWGEAQAERYVRDLFARFQAIADRALPWRRIAAEFGVDGYVCRHEHHFIYWKVMDGGAVAIVTILHERMQQMDLLKEAFEG